MSSNNCGISQISYFQTRTKQMGVARPMLLERVNFSTGLCNPSILVVKGCSTLVENMWQLRLAEQSDVRT